MPPTNAIAVVDHDRLLVVAVHEADTGVELAVDLGAAAEALGHSPHVASRRPEDGHGGSTPDEDADIDTLGELGQEIPHRHGLVAAREGELGREVPAGQVHVRAGVGELFGDSRQELRAVDQDLDAVSGTCWGSALRPVPARRLEGVAPADLAETPCVV